MTLVNQGVYLQILGNTNQLVSLSVPTYGLTGISVILESVGGNFNGQEYVIEVSNDEKNWTTLKTVSLGSLTSTINSFNLDNQSVFANPLHFRIIRFTIPSLGSNIKGKITVGGR